MELTQVQMRAEVYVQITKNELEVMHSCARRHYDATVQKLVASKGTLFNMKRRFILSHEDNSSFLLSFKELDLMKKALEQMHVLKPKQIPFATEIMSRIQEILRFMTSQFAVFEVERLAHQYPLPTYKVGKPVWNV
jgi:hypothetical protein